MAEILSVTVLQRLLNKPGLISKRFSVTTSWKTMPVLWPGRHSIYEIKNRSIAGAARDYRKPTITFCGLQRF
jgi:hypothetical protein